MSCVMYYRLGFDAHIIHLHYKMFKLGEKSVKQREKNNHSRYPGSIPYSNSLLTYSTKSPLPLTWITTIDIKPLSLNLIKVFLQSVLYPGVSDSFKL